MVKTSDVLSTLAQKIIESGSCNRLVVSGATSAEAARLLRDIRPDQLLTVRVTSEADAEAMLAGLWLWHDGLDECHRIAQAEPKTAARTYAFWHALMHRREGDFSNAKYWFARCAGHPALAEVGLRVKAEQTSSNDSSPFKAPSVARLLRAGWDPNAFVDWVEQLHRHPDAAEEAAATRIQKLEWQSLFDYCVAQAVGPRSP